MKINYKDGDLAEYYELNNTEKSELEIKLKGINNIINTRCMFYECSSLISLPDISKWNTSKVKDMSFMFGK